MDLEIQEIKRELDELRKDVQNDTTVINAHPMLFIILLILFFITMDTWTIAAQRTIDHFHPTGELLYWEYIYIGFILLLVLILVGHYTGIRIGVLNA